GAWFALASRLDQSDYLAVSYIPVGETSCSSGRCVGTFPVTARPDPSFVDTLRLVYDPRPGVTAATPSFRFEIRSAYRVGGSEVTRETVTLALTVNRRERTVAADYTIDYATGQVQFRNPDALFPVGGVAQVRAQFEERAAFVVSPTSIFGLAGRYDLGARGTVNFTGLFQREQSAFTRPPL